jgi:hypothetical protein
MCAPVVAPERSAFHAQAWALSLVIIIQLVGVLARTYGDMYRGWGSAGRVAERAALFLGVVLAGISTARAWSCQSPRCVLVAVFTWAIVAFAIIRWLGTH